MIVGALALAACKGNLPSVVTGTPPSASAPTDELGDPLTSFQDITHYNNYYEFSTNKEMRGKPGQGFPHLPLEHRGLRLGQ